MRTEKRLHQLIGVAAALLILLAAGCKDKIHEGNTSQETRPIVKANTAVAEIVKQPEIYEASGTIQPRTAAVLSAKVMGEIKKILVREGDVVKAGDLLIKIEDSQIAAQLRQAEAALAEANQAAQAAQAGFEAAQASMSLAQKTFDRYESLLKNDSVSLQEYDEVKGKHEQATGALAQAKSMRDASHNKIEQVKAALEAARTTYQDTSITAPYDATVTGKMVNLGDMAAPGVPLLKLEDTGSYEVYMVLPESYIRYVSVGDKLSVVVPSLQSASFDAIIKTINPAADPTIRSFQLKAGLPDVPQIRAGMFARVMIPVGETEIILIPDTALVHHGQLTGAYIVDAEKITHFRLVRTGRVFDTQVEVLSGINKGDVYITHVDEKTVDGAQVEEI
ncbi:MAG: efflux RND transporter periplasmic adaptor subunit [Proteobacteria bacterium]|nr:efflux RND transporter periplasmic adaptor subunit [Pseudomonadota bacterium]